MSFTQYEDANSVLSGFVITQGRHSLASAIYCDNSSPTISNCLIVGNKSLDGPGPQGTVLCIESQARFKNCTIADNRGCGLYLESSSVSVESSILWGNEPADLYYSETSQCIVSYSNLGSGSAIDSGTTNLSTAPGFAAPGCWKGEFWRGGDCDYHLLSEGGRWDPLTSAWVNDRLTSPLIDAGNPLADPNQESFPNGWLINVGAYGGSSHASRSLLEP